MHLQYATVSSSLIRLPNKTSIGQAGRVVLDAGKVHHSKPLADFCDPDKMPSDLLTVRKVLGKGKAVEDVYGANFDGDKGKIVAYLFRLYLHTA